MKSELIVDVQPKDLSIALVEDDNLVEFQKQEQEENYSVGNMYFAKVKKIMPGLNACFVDVGYKHEAFLHYQDLGISFLSYKRYIKQLINDKRKITPIANAKIQPSLPKEGNIKEELTIGDKLLVQVIKEPISTKGPRLTCELSFAGRFIVLIPFNNKVAVSSKIKSAEERTRLKQLLQSLRPSNFGIIIRTAAEGKRASELDNELKSLLQKWDNAINATFKCINMPKLVYEETNRAVAMIRDLFNPTFEAIRVNDQATYHDIRDYIDLIAPDKKDIVTHYTGSLPIMDNYSITKQIKTSFGRIVSFKRGAYLVIEHTEALHVVDVNSGNKLKSSEGQEENALEVNLGAADELARQLRLRDMGGIIIVDFIDMDKPENRQILYERMVANMQNDRSKHTILPLTKFGLMQITRQRVRPVMDVVVEETCPSCFGTGKVKSSVLFVESLEEKIQTLMQHLEMRKISLHVHPYVAAFINKGFISQKLKWRFKYGFGLKIIPSQKLAFLQYQIFDSNGEEINMMQEKEFIESVESEEQTTGIKEDDFNLDELKIEENEE